MTLFLACRFARHRLKGAGVSSGKCWLILALAALAQSEAAFVERFEEAAVASDDMDSSGWVARTGDGEAEIEMQQQDGRALVKVDAREDRRNIWWAMIRHGVSDHVDQEELLREDRELRVETRIRVSHAPRRVNLHFNHQRTTDFHSNLREFDIPDTENWHTISFTTRSFDVRLQDDIFVQMALMDWGRETYEVEIDYFKVEVVDPSESGPDLGSQLPYRPSVPSPSEFGNALPALEAAHIDEAYPWVNFQGWHASSGGERESVLALSEAQTVILRWDLSQFQGQRPSGWGVLELATHSAQRADTDLEEFGELRLVEILDGDPEWARQSVTFETFTQDQRLDDVLNGQMIIDVPPALDRGERTLLAVSPPVLQRMIDGRTKGLALRPQGALIASFFTGGGSSPGMGPKLYFNVE